MHINVSGLLRNFASVRRAALAGETVVIATRDGNLVLAAQPEPPSGAVEGAGDRPDAALALSPARATASPLRAPAGEPRPAGASRFVARAVIADAARSAPRLDAERFRADLDALIDPQVDG